MSFVYTGHKFSSGDVPLRLSHNAIGCDAPSNTKDIENPDFSTLWLRETIWNVAREFTAAEQCALRLFFVEELSLKQVGEKLGVPQERARTILRRALHRFKHPTRIRRLEGFL